MNNLYRAVIILLYVFFGIGCGQNLNENPSISSAATVQKAPYKKAVNIDDVTDCEGYLNNKNFYGGNIRMEFNLPNAYCYDKRTNNPVFAGYVEIGLRFGNASRKIKIHDSTGSNQVLNLALGEDGKLMDEMDFTMFESH